MPSQLRSHHLHATSPRSLALQQAKKGKVKAPWLGVPPLLCLLQASGELRELHASCVSAAVSANVLRWYIYRL